jgi:hypothetical protein
VGEISVKKKDKEKRVKCKKEEICKNKWSEKNKK